MQIDEVYPYGVSIADKKMNKIGCQTANFDKVINGMKDDASINALINKIETEYNANLISPLASINQVWGMCNVIVGTDTLKKMNSNSAFCKKVMKIIDECCSISAQQEIRSLSPPAKSAGVIIYSDGSYLCWIESIYNNLEEYEKVSKNNDSVFKWIKAIKNSITEEEILEQYYNLGIVQNIKYINRKRSK